MSSLLYKRHSIIYGAALDRFTGKYAPIGQIVWHMPKGKHGTHSFAISELFSTADEAKAVALEQAIGWATERLRALGMELSVTALERVQDRHR
jgi:hypothetical protein